MLDDADTDSIFELFSNAATNNATYSIERSFHYDMDTMLLFTE